MKQKALFVGPASFNQGTWDTRANYILPDLFSSLNDSFELYMLTSELPKFALPSMERLCARFNVKHVEVKDVDLSSGRDFWEVAVEEYALKIRPDVITNSLGSLRLGKAIAAGAKLVCARSILRIAGDEIGSRLAMGKYENAHRRYFKDIQLEADGILCVDKVIVMSGLERSRLENIVGVDTSKIEVCIRGVDVRVFLPSDKQRQNVRRFLYVGRKSSEKGFDIIEAAAKKVYETNPEIEFIFVGNFESKEIENRKYLGWVHARELPNLYRKADAFVLTSRTEGFPQVVAEAMASGLPCILSRHLFSVLFKNEEDVLLTGLSPSEVANTILRLSVDADLSSRLAVRSRRIAEDILDSRNWQERYLALMQGKSIDEATIFDTGLTDTSHLPEASLRPRVAFISPRVFGLMGTQGSYGLAAAFSRYCPTLLITKETTEARDIPVVADKEDEMEHVTLKFGTGVEERILRLFASFKPDIVHFVNDHSWVDLLPLLKSKYPHATYALDLKTPLLADGEKRLSLHRKAKVAARQLDLVLSLSREIVSTWIPGYSGRVACYPLGIDTKKISPRSGCWSAGNGKLRCVYSGQTHPKRQLSKLLELIASLDKKTKGSLILDLFGAGGGEAEIDSAIERLGLQGIVRRKDAVPQEELFRILAEYDCGLAWVPVEVYGYAPSLKFLEYAAAGLKILATNTPAHQLNINAGLGAVLFDINQDSFRSAIRKVMEDDAAGEVQKINFDMVKKFDFNHIVEHVLLPEYIQLRDGSLRMLFITPRVLGQMATPGTYLSVEAYAEQCELHVIAKPRTSDDEVIVHVPRKDLCITLLDPNDIDYYNQIRKVCLEFSPNIVCIGLGRNWNSIAVALRKDFPSVALALEIKTPAMGKKGERIYDRECKNWQKDHYALDGIIAPSKGMMNTFIKNIKRPFLEHRSIISYETIKKRNFSPGRFKCRKFVFSGSLAKKRKLDTLIQMIGKLPKGILDQVHFDFFGDGPALEELKKLSASLGLASRISFLGAIPQAHLFNRYCDYDAGIAWIPKDIYDSAPSLKLIEYCASGIMPLATSTSGQMLLKKFGFYIDYFEEDDQKSFTDAMLALVEVGVEPERLEANIHRAKDFDYRLVVGNEIFPFYRHIVSERRSRKVNKDTGTAQSWQPFNPLQGWMLQTLRDLETEVANFIGDDVIAQERYLHAKRMRLQLLKLKNSDPEAQNLGCP
jgi:glycosyltransferase involved in cell wall biosynthesis